MKKRRERLQNFNFGDQFPAYDDIDPNDIDMSLLEENKDNISGMYSPVKQIAEGDILDMDTAQK